MTHEAGWIATGMSLVAMIRSISSRKDIRKSGTYVLETAVWFGICWAIDKGIA